MIKQVIVMRTDLNMRKGKMVAQGAHASMASLLTGFIKNEDTYKIGTDEVYEWLNGAFTKICVQCSSEEELDAIYAEAQRANLLCALITDNGLTEFKGVPTKTCLAIGPNDSEDIDKITKHLKLL